MNKRKWRVIFIAAVFVISLIQMMRTDDWFFGVAALGSAMWLYYRLVILRPIRPRHWVRPEEKSRRDREGDRQKYQP